MLGNFNDEDVRIQKTNEALMQAISKLLDLRGFNKITVIDLCQEAKIGRATFYAHFQDKYDLLEDWLSNLKPEIICEDAVYKDTETRINTFLNNNSKKIKHLLENANSETYGLLSNFILSLLNMGHENMSLRYIVLSKFCCGGILNYLEWQEKSKLKYDAKLMNAYFYDILNILQKWNGNS